MRCSVLLLVVFSFAQTPIADAVGDDDAAAIKKLVPKAAAMARDDFMRLAKMAAPKADDFEDRSLTLVLLNLRTSPDDNDKRKQQFRFVTKGFPKASDIVSEVYRDRRIGGLTVAKKPVTIIHLDRITACTAKVEDDRATGTVTFKVPDLYEGKVDYVAQRKEDQWQIVQFMMPAFEIHITRGENGKWKSKAKK